MTKIENMVDLRLRCIELALEFYKNSKGRNTKDVKDCASNFAHYILGESDLPEIVEDNGDF